MKEIIIYYFLVPLLQNSKKTRGGDQVIILSLTLVNDTLLNGISLLSQLILLWKRLTIKIFISNNFSL